MAAADCAKTCMPSTMRLNMDVDSLKCISFAKVVIFSGMCNKNL